MRTSQPVLRHLPVFIAFIGTLFTVLPGAASAQSKKFQVEESTIADVHRAIQSGATTCKGVVQAYLERAKAYNGVCTRLITKDGKSIAPTTGQMRAGSLLRYPTDTVDGSKILPTLADYKGLPIEFGRMEPTISDPTVMQQFGMRAGVPNAGQLNALETLNLRGERSVTCKAKCDTHPSKGALPKTCPVACEDFRKQPDALERAAELDAQYGTKPDLEKLPMYCVAFAWKDWYDATDMRATGGNDVNFAMDAPKVDSPDIADLRAKGAISYAIANAMATTGPSSATGPGKAAAVTVDGNIGYGVWGGQPCNPYDTERVPRGSSSGSGVSVGGNLAACSICEQTSASCKGPASRNNIVNLLPTKGLMMDGGLGYAHIGDRAGIHCRTLEDAVRVLDAAKGFDAKDMYTAIPASFIPQEPFTTFLVKDAAVADKPLKGMRIAVVREFMVKHVKNDAAISDQIDGEIKAVLRDQLGAELVESIDPMYPDDPSVPNMKYTFQDAFAEILAHNVPEYFWQKTASGELEFAVPGWDVTTVDYAIALATGAAPLSPGINLRRISSGLANPRSAFMIDKYLRDRGDARVKDWASWVANAKWKEDAQKVAAENFVASKDQDNRADPDGVSFLKMSMVMKLVVQKVMYENGIDAFVNPEQTTPPYKLGGAGEPMINNRPTISCCTAFTALIGAPEIEVPAGYTSVVYEPQYALSPDKTQYRAVTGTVKSQLPHAMPISMMFWSAPATDSTLIKVASAYESATHHRKPPEAFGPVNKGK